VAGAERQQEVPAPGEPGSEDYRNLMKPASPNVLLTLATPATVRVLGLAARRCGGSGCGSTTRTRSSQRAIAPGRRRPRLPSDLHARCIRHAADSR